MKKTIHYLLFLPVDLIEIQKLSVEVRLVIIRMIK